MKLPCPYCTENIVYDHNLAGKTIKCSYCQKNILMTPFDKLPPDYQQEYKDELEKIRKKQEAEQRKIEEKRVKDLRRQELEKQQELEQQEAKKQNKIKERFDKVKKKKEKRRQQLMQQDWDNKVAEAERRIPEEELIQSNYFGIVVNRSYSVLRVIAFVNIIIGIILFIIGLFSLIIGLNEGHLGYEYGYNIFCLLFGGISLCASAEFIFLMVNIADDIRVSKALLKRIAYSSKEVNTPNISENPTIPVDADIHNLFDTNLTPINDNNLKKDSNEIIPPPIRQIRESNQ